MRLQPHRSGRALAGGDGLGHVGADAGVVDTIRSGAATGKADEE
mgnify:CR=1 FL=1